MVGDDGEWLETVVGSWRRTRMHVTGCMRIWIDMDE